MPVWQPVPFYVYVLVDPNDGEIRYVGYTRCLCARLKGHLQESQVYWLKDARGAWIRSLTDDGLEPILSPIAGFHTEDEAKEAEKDWIRRFMAIGCNLVNGGCKRVVQFEEAKPR